MTTIETSDLSQAQVFAALYNHARPFGMGVLHAVDETLTESDAQAILDEWPSSGGEYYFDYFRGRLMKVRLATTFIDAIGFDRDYGQGAAQRIINGLRHTVSQAK